MAHRRVLTRTFTALIAAAALLPGPAQLGHASEPSPPTPAPDITKMDYHPIGFYSPGDPIPAPDAPPTDPNPSGKWVAYDTNVFEALALPSRHPGDTSADDPPGTGDPRHGFCPPNDPTYLPWGKCVNHQLEYLDYFEHAMKEILGDFGVVVTRYPFHSPGTGSHGGLFDASDGQAYNVSATVPGADHPEESVLVSGHYDFTDSGPAAGWDSQEGHATVIRIAKIMADYWRATGTRPSATVKFIPWDSEESGAWGSLDYVQNIVPPGEESKVRAYFNLDPCAGAYPAFKYGNPAVRVPEVIQLADPATYDDPVVKARITRFNTRAKTVIDEVFDHLDDELTIAPGVTRPIFVSDDEATAEAPSQRSEIVTALGGLLLFSSDYTRFSSLGIPIFNLFPDYFGPHADATPASAEGATILHTPRDNLTTLNALTSSDATGLGASEGWAKGMEMCAHVEGWYMLQPEMGGAQTATADPVAYYEALPNEAIVDQPVTFDASGSYGYTDVSSRTLGALDYRWDFGDGTTGAGRAPRHAYRATGRYVSTLTVRDSSGHADQMSVPITVVPSNFPAPVITQAPASDPDGAFTLGWRFDGETKGLRGYSVQESPNLRTLLADDAEGDITRLWEPGPATAPEQPWQRSDSGQPKALGNKRHSGNSSYWTGAFPTPQPAGTNREVVLTLRRPLRIPARGDAQLSYWSLFASEPDDSGMVEAALEDGNPATKRVWETIDTTFGVFAPDEPGALTGDPTALPGDPGRLEGGLSERKVPLDRFAGKNLLLRFTWVLGPSEGNRTQPAGWYVDDIRVEAGTWRDVGRSRTTSFAVPKRAKGLWGFRVVGVYTDGVKTAPSSPARVNVTVGGRAPRGRVLAEKDVRTLPRSGTETLWLAGALLLLGAAEWLRRWVRATWA